MIFKYSSKMKPSLAAHPIKTSTSVEAFHSMMYSTMSSKPPLTLAMRQLLQISKNELESLDCYFNLDIPVKYGTKKRCRINKRLKNFYVESDSRASDYIEALLDDGFSKVSLQDIAKKDEDLMFGTAISSKEDLIYDAIALLTPLGAIVDDPERHDAKSEIIGELIPTEYNAVLCNHQDGNCIHMWTRQTDVSKTDVPLEDDYILPEATDNNDEIVNQSNLNAFLFGYKQQTLFLNRNASNSCYIDARLELLFRYYVLPYIKTFFFKNCDFSNSFDNSLFAAFQNYEDGNSVIGNQLVRNFVWAEGTPFVIDQMDDS
ncbi:hypothetical protein [Parasitella parasitica]|uniref:Uncharacterized protein n=1 Tax=Parasitella parasitica TaxID=35722 RepID=A0A0B7NXC4_9FUNG|nr:hypothetical protein [Parasitella parasitica]